jgi:hypothetical protein
LLTVLARVAQGVDLSRAMADEPAVSKKADEPAVSDEPAAAKKADEPAAAKKADEPAAAKKADEPAAAKVDGPAATKKADGPAKKAESAAAKSRVAPAILVPSEQEIDSPDRKVLIALFVIFAVTTVSWGAARFACNMHPPESRAAPKLPTDRLVLSAKDAAIEFVQRWRSADYSGALETASGDDLVAELQKAKANCAAKANECAREREAAAGRLTTASVLAQDGFTADARVVTMLKGTKETYRVRVRRDGNSGAWKVISKSTESS